jgi:hypothetical protein
MSADLDVNPKSILEGKMIRIQDPRAPAGEGIRTTRVSFTKARMSYAQAARSEVDLTHIFVLI